MDARWAPDPTARHELRWHDGSVWTDHVADGGVTSTDPFDPGGSGWPDAGEGVADDPAGAQGSDADAAPDSGYATPPPATSAPADQSWSSPGPATGGGGTSWPSGPVQTGSPSPASGRSGGGVRTVWVVVIALVALVVGGVIGFIVGIAVDVGSEIGSEFSSGASLGDAVAGQGLALGDTVQGQSGDEGAAHSLTIAAATTLRLEVTAGDFDTVLELYDESGNLVDDDDDDGQGNLSMLETAVEPGEYRVVVRPWAFDGGGSYTLQATG